MIASKKCLYVLTDGGRAKLVRRSPADGHFETLEELEAREALRAVREQLGSRTTSQAQPSTTAGRSSVKDEQPLRAAKEAFIDRVADDAARTCRREGLDGVFLAAPPRLIGPLTERLGRQSSVVGTLCKDLTRTPLAKLEARLGEAIAR